MWVFIMFPLLMISHGTFFASLEFFWSNANAARKVVGLLEIVQTILAKQERFVFILNDMKMLIRIWIFKREKAKSSLQIHSYKTKLS